MSRLQILARTRNITHRRISYIFNNLYELLSSQEVQDVTDVHRLEVKVRDVVDMNWERKAKEVKAWKEGEGEEEKRRKESNVLP